MVPRQALPPDSVHAAVREVFARREYQNWLIGRHPLDWLRDLWHRFQAWVDRLGTTHPGLYQVLLWASVLVLIALLAHIGYTVWLIHRRTVQPAGQGVASGFLPVTGPAPGARADALAREGRYTEALAYRFAAMLLDLESVRAVTLRSSKTPAEYVGEAQLDPLGRDTFSTLVARLYAHLFGAVPCDAGAYRTFGDDAALVIRHVAPH
jgi:hypothetical protein